MQGKKLRIPCKRFQKRRRRRCGCGALDGELDGEAVFGTLFGGELSGTLPSGVFRNILSASAFGRVCQGAALRPLSRGGALRALLCGEPLQLSAFFFIHTKTFAELLQHPCPRLYFVRLPQRDHPTADAHALGKLLLRKFGAPAQFADEFAQRAYLLRRQVFRTRKVRHIDAEQAADRLQHICLGTADICLPL